MCVGVLGSSGDFSLARDLKRWRPCLAQFKELVNNGNSDIEVIQLDWYPKDDF